MSEISVDTLYAIERAVWNSGYRGLRFVRPLGIPDVEGLAEEYAERGYPQLVLRFDGPAVEEFGNPTAFVPVPPDLEADLVPAEVYIDVVVDTLINCVEREIWKEGTCQETRR